MTIKERVKALADEKNISISKLEQTLGFGNSTIMKWDKILPNASRLQAVADFFDVSVDFLLGRTADTQKDIRRIERAYNKMSDVEQEKMMKILEVSFEELFDDSRKD